MGDPEPEFGETSLESIKAGSVKQSVEQAEQTDDSTTTAPSSDSQVPQPSVIDIDDGDHLVKADTPGISSPHLPTTIIPPAIEEKAVSVQNQIGSDPNDPLGLGVAPSILAMPTLDIDNNNNNNGDAIHDVQESQPERRSISPPFPEPEQAPRREFVAPLQQYSQEDVTRRLEFLVAMFKSRNLDLVRENNALRLEIEQLRQQHSISDGAILQELLALSPQMNAQAPNLSIPQVQSQSQAIPRFPQALLQIAAGAAKKPTRGRKSKSKNPRRQKALEFVSELSDAPTLTAEFTVQTEDDTPETKKSGGSGKQLEDMMPCIYTA